MGGRSRTRHRRALGGGLKKVAVWVGPQAMRAWLPGRPSRWDRKRSLVGRRPHAGGRSFTRRGRALSLKGGASGARGLGGPGAAPGHNGPSGRLSAIHTLFAAAAAGRLAHRALASITRRRRAMYSGNRSGGQGYWEDGAGAEGAAPAGTRSPAPLFSPTAYERLALLLGGLALLGVGGNLLVLLLYSKFPRLRTPTHLFLVNLSLGDLLVSLFGVTFTFASCLRNGWVWDAVGCAWDGFSGSLFGELPGTCPPRFPTFPGYSSSGLSSSLRSSLLASHHP